MAILERQISHPGRGSRGDRDLDLDCDAAVGLSRLQPLFRGHLSTESLSGDLSVEASELQSQMIS